MLLARLPRAVLAATPLLAHAHSSSSKAAAPQPATLRVAVVQMLVGGDKAANLARCAGLLERACDGGAQLVVLPEVWNSPYAVDQFRAHA